ncbi:hypothetical protein ZIOFF_024908 [Zingiber officinale]|uniref:Uncharacterized protein n=1 Tax=Zingiber officinale TaxID=94328 RepID=A0A8J5L6J6_ZINOF|nr:hypothetical protein ZIOFF_024908 [Zingiber officinale]
MTTPATYSDDPWGPLRRSIMLPSSEASPSPSPLALVCSFFSDDPESESRYFTQLLVGAMNSPTAMVRRPMLEREKTIDRGDLDGGGVDRGSIGCGSGLVRLGQERLVSLAVSQQQAVRIPPGLGPASLLDSSGFLLSRI